MAASKKHPGFKGAQQAVMQGGNYTPEQAAAIVANASRNASAKAKAANPRLKKVQDNNNSHH